MRLLFIGGTGLISSACTDLAVARGHDVWLLNRAVTTTYPLPEGAHVLSRGCAWRGGGDCPSAAR